MPGRLVRLSPFVLLAALLALAVLAAPAPAGAHAVLERSAPVQGEKIPLDRVPQLVETWYSEPLERSLTTLEVLNTEGNPVHDGETRFSDDAAYAAIALPPDLGPGIYTLTYENVSTVDGHRWAGAFSFIILEADGSVPPGTAFMGEQGGQGFLPGTGDTALRWLGMLAAVAITGSFVFLLFVARPAAGFLDEAGASSVEAPPAAIAAWVTLAAAPLLVIAALGQALILADRLGGMDQLDDILFDTRTGSLWLARSGLALALMLLVVPLLRGGARADSRASVIGAVALLGGLGLLMTYSLGSHGAAEGGAFWAVAADFAHFVATAAWLGVLVQLPVLFRWTRTRLDDPSRLLYRANALDRFSWIAVVSVVVLIGTGVFNGFVQLPNTPSLWETSYGRVLIAKLTLIVPMLAVATLNAGYLKPRLVAAIDALHADGRRRAPGAGRERLSEQLAFLQRVLPRTTAVEFLTGVAVLVTVAILTQTTTAGGELRLDAARPAEDFSTSGRAGDLDATFTIEPFGIGVSTYSVVLERQGAELGDVLGVRLRAFYDDPTVEPSAGISGTDLHLEPTADEAVWRAESALLTQPGDWRVQVRIQRRGEDDVRTDFSVEGVGGFLARPDQPEGLYDLPFTFVDWNVVAGGAFLAVGVGVFLIWHNRPPSWSRGIAGAVGLSSATALVAGAVFVFGVHTHEGTTARARNPIEPTEESIAVGRELYMANCAVCHGQDGRGMDQAADLTFHVPGHNDGTLFYWISEGIPVDEEVKRMPAWKDDFTEDQRWHIVNFIRAAFGSGQFTPVLPEDLS